MHAELYIFVFEEEKDTYNYVNMLYNIIIVKHTLIMCIKVWT